MCSCGAAYWPSLAVVIVRVIPVSVLVIEMLALATAAPVGSVMVPTMVASCASADAANRSMKARARNGSSRRKRLRTKHQLPAFVGEREFIGKPPGLRVEARPTGHGHFVNVY